MKHERYCFALDLKNDPEIIAGYKAHHIKLWPDIYKSIKDAGIEVMDIYLVANRLFMIMEVNDSFSFERKNKADASSPIVQKWEKLMSTYQQEIPGTDPNSKWVLMEKIFEL